MVYVLNRYKKPLMPCNPAKARMQRKAKKEYGKYSSRADALTSAGDHFKKTEKIIQTLPAKVKKNIGEV